MGRSVRSTSRRPQVENFHTRRMITTANRSTGGMTYQTHLGKLTSESDFRRLRGKLRESSRSGAKFDGPINTFVRSSSVFERRVDGLSHREICRSIARAPAIARSLSACLVKLSAARWAIGSSAGAGGHGRSSRRRSLDRLAIHVGERVVGLERLIWRSERCRPATWRRERPRAWLGPSAGVRIAHGAAAGSSRQPFCQHVGDLSRRLDSRLGRFGHHPRANVDQGLRSVAAIQENAGGRLRLMGLNSLRQRPGRERRMARQQVIQRATQAIEIGPIIDPVTIDRLLGAR